MTDSGNVPGGTKTAPPTRTSWLTKVGMGGALVLAGVAVVGAVVLCWRFVSISTDGKVPPLAQRLLLSGIGCFVATAFGILGFALFLIQAEGAFKGNLEGGAPQQNIGIETTAPGLVVFICATVIMYLSLKMSFSAGMSNEGAQPDHHQAATPNGSAPTATEPLGGKMKMPDEGTSTSPAPTATAPPGANDGGASDASGPLGGQMEAPR